MFCPLAQAGNCKPSPKDPVLLSSAWAHYFLIIFCLCVCVTVSRQVFVSRQQHNILSFFLFLPLCVHNCRQRSRWRSGSERVHMRWVILTLWLWWHATAHARAHGGLHLTTGNKADEHNRWSPPFPIHKRVPPLKFRAYGKTRCVDVCFHLVFPPHSISYHSLHSSGSMLVYLFPLFLSLHKIKMARTLPLPPIVQKHIWNIEVVGAAFSAHHL